MKGYDIHGLETVSGRRFSNETKSAGGDWETWSLGIAMANRTDMDATNENETPGSNSTLS